MPKDLRRTFDPEFKINVVEMHLKANKSVRGLCEMYDLDRQTIHRWKKQYLEEGKQSFINKRLINAKELDDIKMENEILKKANAYFAQKKEKR